MQLLYFKGSHPNFGDDLNALLWPQIAPALFGDAVSPKSADGDAFLGIGTIIGMRGADGQTLHVFSSGAGYLDIDIATMARCRFWCVRGPLSAQLLGLDPDAALTDGAILAPSVLPVPHAGRRGTVVVPHWETLLADEPGGRWRTASSLAGMTLVDPMQPPAQVIAKIAAASLVLTESLHGAIIADTYGVPWIAFATSANVCVFKWLDWARSMGVRLRLHAVRPPHTAWMHRLGRPALGAWGACVEPDEAAAMADLRLWSTRRHPPPPPDTAAWIKTRLKWRLDSAPRVQSLLGYRPSATAAALARLAKAEPSLSDEARRRRLTERMTERLDALIRERMMVQA